MVTSRLTNNPEAMDAERPGDMESLLCDEDCLSGCCGGVMCNVITGMSLTSSSAGSCVPSGPDLDA